MHVIPCSISCRLTMAATEIDETMDLISTAETIIFGALGAFVFVVLTVMVVASILKIIDTCCPFGCRIAPVSKIITTLQCCCKRKKKNPEA